MCLNVPVYNARAPCVCAVSVCYRSESSITLLTLCAMTRCSGDSCVCLVNSSIDKASGLSHSDNDEMSVDCRQADSVSKRLC